jgi:hypothetical protein
MLTPHPNTALPARLRRPRRACCRPLWRRALGARAARRGAAPARGCAAGARLHRGHGARQPGDARGAAAAAGGAGAPGPEGCRGQQPGGGAARGLHLAAGKAAASTSNSLPRCAPPLAAADRPIASLNVPARRRPRPPAHLPSRPQSNITAEGRLVRTFTTNVMTQVLAPEQAALVMAAHPRASGALGACARPPRAPLRGATRRSMVCGPGAPLYPHSPPDPVVRHPTPHPHPLPQPQPHPTPPHPQTS